MFWLYLVLGVLAVLIVGPLVVFSLYIDDWSRDLTTNHAETTRSHSNPLLQPLTIPGQRAGAATHVTDAIEQLDNWKVESVTPEGKRTIIHATRTTKLFKFTDDIRVYLNDVEGGVQITATSQSRVGKGDLGQNPRNIAELMSKVREQVEP
ncbi:DUF1499 domain-containing protein [Bremerella sp. JC770]|uniref:DUF1499 domain-containing protein n=1 Tax=Bremerella sp. JC770 TaxID=3232137 RepID=UPI0034575470